jgi:hypothetical protein
MITAAEAKKLYDDSGAEIEKFLTHTVEKPIIEAAKKGERSVHIHLGTVGQFEHLDQLTPHLQRGVLDKLAQLGYRCSIGKQSAPYVPRGLADDDGNGPSYTNFGLNVHW